MLNGLTLSTKLLLAVMAALTLILGAASVMQYRQTVDLADRVYHQTLEMDRAAAEARVADLEQAIDRTVVIKTQAADELAKARQETADLLSAAKQQVFEDVLKIVGVLLPPVVSKFMWDMDESGAATAIREVVGNAGIVGVRVVDTGGQAFAEAGRADPALKTHSLDLTFDGQPLGKMVLSYDDGEIQAARRRLMAAAEQGRAQALAEAEQTRRRMAEQVQQVRDQAEADHQAIEAALHDDLASTRQDTIVNSILAFLAVLVIVGVVQRVLMRRLVFGPLERIDDVLRRLAHGERQIAVPFQDRRDEIGERARSVQAFGEILLENDRLRAAHEEERKKAEEARRRALLEMADELSGEVATTTTDLGGHVERMRQSAGVLSDIAERTSRMADTVASASHEASANVQTVAAATEEFTASIQEIGRQASGAANISQEAAASTERTNQVVVELVEQINTIGDVVKLINDIAAKTNLLALNATIESARAGEAGKGFAVVANEVKQLASQTAKATDQITDRINAMQAASKDARDAIERIRTVIGQVQDVSAAVAAAVEQQGAAIQEIVRNVQAASHGTDTVSRNIAEVSASTMETDTTAGMVREVADHLGSATVSLKTGLENFIGRVRAA